MQFPGLNIGIIADDLTGACDTALQFFSPETHPDILLHSNWNTHEFEEYNLLANIASRNHVWSLNTQSRHHSVEDAQLAVRKAISLAKNSLSVESFYKKMDSTLRGNFAQECLAALEEFKGHCCVIAPAYPEEGRRTVGGYHLVRGIPIEKTSVNRDPLFPVRQSHIPSLLATTVNPDLIEHIPLSVVLHGAGPILIRLRELIQQDKKLVVIDATSNEDLEQIALATQKLQKDYSILPCGSAGLARAIAKQWLKNNQKQDDPIHAYSLSESPILIVSGSNSDVTRTQLGNLTSNYSYFGQGTTLKIVDLTSDQLLGLTPVTELLGEILEAFENNATVVLSSALRETAYECTINLATEHQISAEQTSQKALSTLAELTAQIMQKRSELKLVSIGGETTESICKALGIQTLKLVDEISPSIPLLQDNKGRWIVTKSGGFGRQMALGKVIQFLKQKELSSSNV